MRTSRYLLVVMFLMLGGLSAFADDGQRNARRLVDEGQILPLERILEQVRQRHPGRLLEAELEDEHDGYVYEIELLDADGVVWEFRVDAATGRILERKLED